MGEAYLIEKELKKRKITKKCIEAVQKIKERGEKFALLIKDIIDVASMEKGVEEEIKRERIDIESLLDDTKISFGLLAHNKGLTIEIDIREEIELISDKKILENILFRLLDNAIKFTPSGGFITIGAEKREGGCFILC